jgi:hypothetical protein
MAIRHAPLPLGAIMKPWKIIIAIVVVAIVGFLVSKAQAADQSVHGYTRSDGTYVQPYHRSAPDNNPYNNYGTQGNYNPYTGQAGTAQPQPNYIQPAYPTQPSNRGGSSTCLYGQRC